jgi:hypothetical protein
MTHRDQLDDILAGHTDPPIAPEQLADLIGEASPRERLFLAEALGRHASLWDDPAEADRLWNQAVDVWAARKGLTGV